MTPSESSLAIEVSAIVPTFNRRKLLLRAIDSALAQTCPVDEIIVVDDGSTDGTEAALAQRYGERVRYVRQANSGVSAARNRGMSLARGRYLALLDSDDEWLPDKTARQLAWLRAHPDFGMVVCDVIRIDQESRELDVIRRRDYIREDGWVLRWVLQAPSLVPSSAMFRREVFDDVAGFDDALRTAEDIDFHLRVASRWQIGVTEGPLVRAMRGHDGLSALSQTYDDYVHVMERAIHDAAGRVEESERKRALAEAYVVNARGMLMCGRTRDAWHLARKAWKTRPDSSHKRQLLGLIPLGLKRTARALVPR